MVAWNVPTPGTSSSSTRRPVGKRAPSPSAGSMKSTGTSAAGKVTPSSSKSPVSCTAPSVIGTWLTIVLPMFTCQMRTSQVPLVGTFAGSTRPLAMAKGPTAAEDDLRGAGRRAAHAVRVLAVGIGRADHAQAQGVAGRAGDLRGLGQVVQAEEHALRRAAAQVGGGDAELGREGPGHAGVSPIRRPLRRPPPPRGSPGRSAGARRPPRRWSPPPPCRGGR